MKRLVALFLLSGLCLSLLGGCAAASAAKELSAQPVKLTTQDLSRYDPDAPKSHAALSDFGLDLLKNTRQKESTLVSPLSISIALAMAANGADGDTLEEFQQVLGDGLPLESINAAFASLMWVYSDGLGGSTKCSIANSLWVDPEGQVREDFIGKCAGLFEAQIFQGDLSAPGIVKDLNGWVSQHTNKMIPQIISQPFDKNTAALLVNALYLKNTWATEFDPQDTAPRDFTHGDGSTERLHYLNHFSLSFPYLSNETCEGAILPYDDGRLGFFALMPKLSPDAPDFDTWLAELKGTELASLILSGEDAKFLRLSLPKFEQEWSGELQDILPGMGLECAFDPDTADFSLLGDNPYGYYLSQVIHAAKMEVNEKGTEAAAATVAAAGSGSAAPPEDGIILVFDRPFLYGIVDLQNGIPLFLGTFE
ncbi:serpin family protein [Lawsonibacter sp. LCP25S3_G6]|uniref:serpin family protein n=1 Tax=unclassified Lawsonibacter TaxID=2617946 RepID=UPI003F9843AE